MKDLVKRIRAQRSTTALESAYAKKPSTAEFKQNCGPTMIGYSKL